MGRASGLPFRRDVSVGNCLRSAACPVPTPDVRLLSTLFARDYGDGEAEVWRPLLEEGSGVWSRERIWKPECRLSLGEAKE